MPTSGERSFVDVPKPPGISCLVRLFWPFAASIERQRLRCPHALAPLDSLITRRISRRLVRSAYTESKLLSFISETGIQNAGIRADGIGFEPWVHKPRRLVCVFVDPRSSVGVLTFPIIL